MRYRGHQAVAVAEAVAEAAAEAVAEAAAEAAVCNYLLREVSETGGRD